MASKSSCLGVEMFTEEAMSKVETVRHLLQCGVMYDRRTSISGTFS